MARSSGVRRRRSGVAVAMLVVTSSGAVAAAVTSIDGPATVGRTATRLTPFVTQPPATEPPVGTSLRFSGTGTGDVDRVKVALAPGTLANVGADDLTLELWIKGFVADNPAAGCGTGDAAWINGHVVVDRDVYGPGDRGDFGLSLLGGRLAWGASLGDAGATVCGDAAVLDGAWHHVAVARHANTGRLEVWVDGVLDAERATSPATGDISYRVGRTTAWPGSDPFLVFGAEKHDAGAGYPSFSGWIDDVRISSTIRYTAPFVPPSAPHPVDGATAALYRFDEPGGDAAIDQVGTSPGVLRIGGPAEGPVRSADTPFG